MNRVDIEKNRIKNKKYNKNTNNENNKFKLFMVKFFVVLLAFSISTMIIKKDPKLKKDIYNNIYNNNFSFAYFKNIYNQYIGNILPFQNIFKEKKVFSEKLEYKTLSKYNKGVKLTLDNNYPIPIIKGGIVIFVGEKDYMNTVIIQQSDGIDVWYCNLSNTNVKLYDYIEDGKIVGEAKNNELYLLFQKNGVEIDYKEVLK